jgi:hypothetical protein
MSTTITFRDDPRSNVRGVTYNADIYCVPCGVSEYLSRSGLEGHGLSHVAQDALDLLGRFALGSAWKEGHEHEWDTDDFPKIILRSYLGDEYECCGKCGWDIAGRS